MSVRTRGSIIEREDVADREVIKSKSTLNIFLSGVLQFEVIECPSFLIKHSAVID